MFEFHKVGFRNADGDEVSSWLCYIATQKQIDSYLRSVGERAIYIWKDIKDGQKPCVHCETNIADQLSYLLDIKMLREGREKKYISVVEGLDFICTTMTSSAIKLFLEDGKVYVNKNGACRTTSLRNDGKLDEEIFDKCTNKNFVFPSISSNDIRINKWIGGKHFYIQVNGKNVEIDGVVKYNTVKAAETAKKKFLKNNRFKNAKL